MKKLADKIKNTLFIKVFEESAKDIKGVSSLMKKETPKIYNCWDILKEFFTEAEIKEAGEKMVACGCSVCRIHYLLTKFPDRVPKEKRFCWGA